MDKQKEENKNHVQSQYQGKTLLNILQSIVISTYSFFFIFMEEESDNIQLFFIKNNSEIFMFYQV